MSSVYRTTTRVTRTTADHRPLIVVGRSGASTPYYPLEHAEHVQVPPTRSATGQSHTQHQKVDLTQARRRAEQTPPPLLPIKKIPLPPLAEIPIFVHPVLSYTPCKVVLEYDLSMPPSTACLSPTTKAHRDWWEWRRQPAMNPSTVGSMTIRVPGLERVVVVFPATLDSRVVTVGDVLDAVYRAVQTSVIEHRERAAQGQNNWPGSGQVDLARWVAEEYVAKAVQKHGGGSHWWAGLYPCQKERDVWILRTRVGY